ncbi:hypothetical protein [Sphingomonas elodea]|uniref:hypothetical protein n=1 Tax=Sphingomonas elodea TaxID=179878 RepID=UPI0002630D41|nr:hypothetical protein [Sphingomonas elodea]
MLDHEDLDQILTEGCRLIAQAVGTDLAKVMESSMIPRPRSCAPALDDAWAKIEACRADFNESRPYLSLGFLTLAEFGSSAGVNPGR